MQSTKQEEVRQVDEEIQSRISNYVSALGGFDAITKEYKLGDEALQCLRDLRKWIQNFDVQHNTLDVAIAIANTTLVQSDLIEIIYLWDQQFRNKNNSYMDRLVLACLELLVPLTWPVKIRGVEATTSYFSKSMYIRNMQTTYKKAILAHKGKILKIILRISAQNGLDVPYLKRKPRDDGILTMICSLFRNLLFIETGDELDRVVTIAAYEKQHVLDFFVTLGGSMGELFDTQDLLLVEILFYLIKGVNPSILYTEMDDKTNFAKSSKDLLSLLENEKQINNSSLKATRHSRFGTMIAMKKGRGKFMSVSGHKGILDVESTMDKLDETKKWRKRTQNSGRNEADTDSYYSETASAIHNDKSALQILRKFCEEFIDTAYNPLFAKVRKSIEAKQRKIEVPMINKFLYLSGWFVETQRMRYKSTTTTSASGGSNKTTKKDPDFEAVGTTLLDSSVNTTLSLLMKGLEQGEYKSADLVHAGIVCIRKILEAIREMSYCKNELYRDVAEGMKSRLFYQEVWLDLFAAIPKTARGKSLSYAYDVIELTYVVMKTLDEYSKQHTYVYVRSKNDRESKNSDSRRRRRRRNDRGETDHEESARITNERKLNFEKFVQKYVNTQVIELYERVLSDYKELSDDLILKIFSFYKRTFGKTGDKALFYRIGFMKLLMSLTSKTGLPTTYKSRKVAEEFLTYYVQKFVILNKEMPSIHLNLCGAMSAQDSFYYNSGGKDRITQKFKPPKFELEFTKEAQQKFNDEKLFCIVVQGLIESFKLEFVDEVLNFTEELIIQSHGNFESKPFTTDLKTVKDVHSDALSRFFLREVGFYVNTSAGVITFPSNVDELRVIDRIDWIKRAKESPVDLDGRKAKTFLKRDDEEEPNEEHNENNNRDVDQTRDSNSMSAQGEYEPVRRVTQIDDD